jgi:hypothetical protein
VPDPGGRYDAMHVFQSLTEIQKDIVHLSTKVDRAISDLDKLDKKVSVLGDTLNLARGFGLAAVILIPVCAGFIWWLAGDKLNHIRDVLTRPAITQPQKSQP